VLAAAGIGLWVADPGRSDPADARLAASEAARADVRRAREDLGDARRDATRARRGAERQRFDTGLEDPAGAYRDAQGRLTSLQAQRDGALISGGPAAAAPLEQAVAQAQQEVFDLRVQAERALGFAERERQATVATQRAGRALDAARAEVARAAGAGFDTETDDATMSGARWAAVALGVLAVVALVVGLLAAVTAADRERARRRRSVRRADPVPDADRPPARAQRPGRVAATPNGSDRTDAGPTVDLAEIERRLAELERRARTRREAQPAGDDARERL
jgi:hypothetical protein